jgi:hypothetical protein
MLDSVGGLVAGAVAGAVLVWVAGAVALQIPGHPNVRSEVRRSQVLRHLDAIAPPRDVLRIKVGLTGVSSAVLR